MCSADVEERGRLHRQDPELDDRGLSTYTVCGRVCLSGDDDDDDDIECTSDRNSDRVSRLSSIDSSTQCRCQLRSTPVAYRQVDPFPVSTPVAYQSPSSVGRVLLLLMTSFGLVTSLPVNSDASRSPVKVFDGNSNSVDVDGPVIKHKLYIKHEVLLLCFRKLIRVYTAWVVQKS